MSKKLPKNARILITLDNGAVVRMRAVSPMLISKIDEAVAARWEAEGRALAEKPTYTVTTAAGVDETHEHDAVSIAEVEDPEIRAGLEAQLAKAEEDVKAFGRTRSSLLIDIAVLESLEVVEGPSIEKWTKLRTRMGLPIPTDEDELKLAFVKEYILTSATDMGSIITAMLEVTGVKKESVDAAKANFRDQVEGRQEPEGSADPAVEVDVLAGEPVLGADGGEVLGEVAEPVLGGE